MAMIKCPECGKEISSRANACPNCGCPIGSGSGGAAGEKRQVEVVEKVPVVEATPKSCKVLKLVSGLMMFGGFGGCFVNIGNSDAMFYIWLMLAGLILYAVVGLYVWWNHR